MFGGRQEGFAEGHRFWSVCRYSEVRIEHSLNNNEEEFEARKRKDVQQSLKKLNITCSQNEVPNIALLGSGGGEKAMVGLLGSLDQLQKTGLLDCVLYLSGVSGSTWCMASLYQESDWSTKLETVKDKIVQRLSGPGVSWGKALIKLFKYYYEKDIFSLTDVWAVMVVTDYVKEIDKHKLSEQWNQQSKDPFPIYTVIDKHSKQSHDADPWFEFTPYEAGYSLTGAFVETSDFGSKFENSRKIKNQPEIDMLYLQGLCGSAIADGDVNFKFILEKIIEFILYLIGLLKKKPGMLEEMRKEDPNVPPIDEYHQVLMDLVNLSVLNGKDPSDLDEFIGTMLNDKAVPAALLESETRDYEDGGLLLNSPYFSVLREERNIDLIISLDFSDGDPFKTVKDAADMCKTRNIPFPEVRVSSEDIKKPKDFYVFNGQNTPTVIHIPLFNVGNCGDKIEDWGNKYGTFQNPYSAEMITDLMEVAGKNITNNKEKLLDEIRQAIKIHK
ncbi:cytosolic phospholipase A2 gamma-like [Siphateles boraxobius]|uniref:cytosolic phospholipase A2 gamma-like n=1 Tax=Siphateles boraxobius TaxID=180520 RepID=UPI004063E27B